MDAFVGTGFVASGWATGEFGVRDSVAQAVAGLGGSAPGLVLMFPDASHAPRDALAQARGAAGSAQLAGMTSAGALYADGVLDGGCAAVAFSEETVAGVGMAVHASRDLRAAGRAAALTATAGIDLPRGRSVLLVFVDPTSGDAGEAVDGAYEAVGASVPLAGGGANGAAPALFAGEQARRDAVVAVALVSPDAIGIGIAHGCRPRGIPAIVTRAEGRTILELDGRPADSVYLERLGVPPQRLDAAAFERLAVLHPLGQPALRGDLRLRHVLGRTPNGGLVSSTHVPPNAVVWLTDQTPASIVASAQDAVRSAVEQLPERPRAAVVFDCAARRRALGDHVAEEAEVLHRAVGGRLAGLYTRGEVGRRRGAKGDLNHAVVVVAFA